MEPFQIGLLIHAFWLVFFIFVRLLKGNYNFGVFLCLNSCIQISTVLRAAPKELDSFKINFLLACGVPGLFCSARLCEFLIVGAVHDRLAERLRCFLALPSAA